MRSWTVWKTKKLNEKPNIVCLLINQYIEPNKNYYLSKINKKKRKYFSVFLYFKYFKLKIFWCSFLYLSLERSQDWRIFSLSTKTRIAFEFLATACYTRHDDGTYNISWQHTITQYGKSPHIRTYQNKNLEAVFPKLCTLQWRASFSLMKHRFLLQGLQSWSLIAVIKVVVVPIGFESFILFPNYLLGPKEPF